MPYLIHFVYFQCFNLIKNLLLRVLGENVIDSVVSNLKDFVNVELFVVDVDIVELAKIKMRIHYLHLQQ